MQKPILLTAVVVLLGVAFSAHAQGLIDGVMGSAIGGAGELGAAAQAPATPAAILANLTKQGYTEIGALTPTQIGGSKGLQAQATSPAGTPVTILVDPLTGKILSATPR